MQKRGGRHVVTALCSNRRDGSTAPHHACAPFSLIQIEGYALRGQNSICCVEIKFASRHRRDWFYFHHADIYFMCVEFIDGRFVGYAPVVEGEEGVAYIGLATSADGVSWSKFARVAASERDVDLASRHFRYRSLDQPVCGMLRRDGRTTLYVQREVAGIYSPSQDCCNKPVTRLEAVDVTRWVDR